MPPENIQARANIGKFEASKIISLESLNVLRQNKEILWFPIASCFLSTVLLALAGFAYLFFVLGGDWRALGSQDFDNLSEVLGYGIMFVFYLVTFFVVNYFEAGLMTVVQARFSGQYLSFHDGMDAAGRNTSKIFIWSLISATVGVVIRVISDKSKILGKIAAGISDAAWSILTYFSLPAIIIGNLSIKDSFQESASIIRKTWGEAIVIKLGIAAYTTVVLLLLIAFCMIVGIIFQSVFVSIFIVIIFIISVVAITIVSSALNSIFKLVLYNYAKTGVIPQGFSPEIVKAAIAQK